MLVALSVAASNDVLRAAVDPTVKPSADFFHYANGGWLKKNPIPPAETGWGISNQVRDELYKRLRIVNDNAVISKSKTGTDQQKVGDFWSTAMDEKKAETLGLKPIQPTLAKIDKLASVADVIDLAFVLQRDGVGSLFSFYIAQDEKDSNKMAVHIGQGGLGLPNRDYYFNPEAGTAKVRSEYLKYLAAVYTKLHVANPAQAATDVMTFETALAKVSRKLEDERDPEKNYNPMSPEDITAKLDPSIDWKAHLGGYAIHPATIIVGQPEFFTGLDAALGSTSLGTLKAYLKAQVFSDAAGLLNKDADDLHFHFYGQILNGSKQKQVRWKRALASENGAIGFILGRIFVKDYFPPASKKRYSDLIENIRTAYHHRIDRLDWMSPETKAKAHEKLSKLVKKVGYPDKWKDYSKLTITRESYFANMLAASRWNFDDDISKLNKPVDRLEWGMTPQTFNAYYDPQNNEIVMPAAAFVIPGLKDGQIDEPLMYGNAGASWIGHEITHGFDDEGRHFDAMGNLSEWWTKEDADSFEKKVQPMIDQFNAYEPLPGIRVNGKACLGENIADYGGVQLGIDAFKLTKSYKEGKKIAGFTPMQRFFLGYALSWKYQQRTEALRNQILSDVHAPDMLRCNGPLSNLPEFYAAFGVKPGDKMWRPEDKRPHIW